MAYPNPWVDLQRAAGLVGALGASAVGGTWLLEGGVGMMVVGVVAVAFAAGLGVLGKSRADLIEADLEQLRRDEAVVQWTVDAARWESFVSARRRRFRAGILGGLGGISLLPLLVLALMLVIGTADTNAVAGWIGLGVGMLWAVGGLALVATQRANRAPAPFVFAPKLCAAGSAVFAWPHGIAAIHRDEEQHTLWITRKGGWSMPAATFGIPVPPEHLDDARGLLPR